MRIKYVINNACSQSGHKQPWPIIERQLNAKIAGTVNTSQARNNICDAHIIPPPTFRSGHNIFHLFWWEKERKKTRSEMKLIYWGQCNRCSGSRHNNTSIMQSVAMNLPNVFIALLLPFAVVRNAHINEKIRSVCSYLRVRCKQLKSLSVRVHCTCTTCTLHTARGVRFTNI